MSKITAQQTEKRREKEERIANLLSPPRLSREETQVLSGIFSDSPDIYTALRDLFFGFNLTPAQKSLLDPVKAIYPLIRKIFLPEITKEIPFSQTFDLWQSKDLQTTTIEMSETYIKAKLLIIDLLELSFARLNDMDLPGVDLTIKPQLPFILGRNGYMAYIDSQIRFLIQHVNMQSMSQEEITQMMNMDSAK